MKSFSNMDGTIFLSLFLLCVTVTSSASLDQAETALTERLLKVLGMNDIGKRGSCDAKYQALPDSGMCNPKFDKDPSATDTKISQGQIKKILKVHNKLRGGVNPAAKNMQKMYWDEEIAVIAQHYASSCPTGHDTSQNRRVPGYGIEVGQNMAWGQQSWKAAIDAWYSEVKDFTYGVDNSLGKVGHFTQVVRDLAGAVGCGYANCPNNPFKETYVCNYAFGNPRIDVSPVLGTPYMSGSACGDCPGNCVDNLCDCNGKICLNGGTLDVGGCTCTCTDLYAGDTCADTNCPPSDPDYCGQPQPMGFPKETCTQWSNVPGECPHMCGLCGKKRRGVPDDAHGRSVPDDAHGRSVPDEAYPGLEDRSTHGKLGRAIAAEAQEIGTREIGLDAEERSHRPGLDEKSHRPGLDEKSHRPNLDEKSHRPLDEKSHRPGLEEKSHRPGLDEKSHRPDLDEKSHRPGLDEKSHRPGLDQKSHRPDVDEKSHRPGLDEKSHRPGLDEKSHRPDLDEKLRAERLLVELLEDLDADSDE